MAHKPPHAHPIEVYGSRWDLLAFPLLILAVLLVVVVLGPR